MLIDARYLPVIAILIGIGLVGCASTPVATDLPTIIENPSEFRNTRVRITAPILTNSPPQGDEYRTWIFIVGLSETYRVMASEEGFNPSTIEKAYRLVEDARKAGGQVTVTGKLRVGPYHEIESGMEIELDSVRYGDVEIRTDKGPFVGRSYPYYHGPIHWHFGYHYYHH